MKRSTTTIVALLAVGLLVTPVLADVVHLKDGRKFEGEVTEEGGRIIIRIGSIKTAVDKDQVARIERRPTPRNEYKERLGKLPAGDPEALYDLGMWCLDKKLPTQANDCFQKVLTLNPGHREAHRRLGHVMRDGIWVSPCPECGGSGKDKCPVCKGLGNTRVTCTECVKGKKTCEACGGRGFLICAQCRGMGGFTCEACRGTGGFWGNEWVWVGGAYVNQPVWHGCPACDGKGTIDCPNCVRGRLDCKQCKNGRYKCPSCDGHGYTRPACANCQGQKKVDCAQCKGTGTIPVFPPKSPPKAPPPPLPRRANEAPAIKE
ncbi:MAG: hypothetical protein GXP25_12905 [Planctomycetes bacterium]|nr:hypothetical protein [Planctomycetota bacterium]